MSPEFGVKQDDLLQLLNLAGETGIVAIHVGMGSSCFSPPWYFHNAYTYIVRYTFLEFITPTPLNLLFYKMMGMKIGKGAHINTTNISDPGLIEIGDLPAAGHRCPLLL